jgi:hypothetical protein
MGAVKLTLTIDLPLIHPFIHPLPEITKYNKI